MAAKFYKHFAIIMALSIFVGGCSQSKESLLQEGTQQRRDGNLQGAVVLLKSALEKDPNYFEARFELAEVYMQSGDLEKAERELQKVELQSPSLAEVTLKMAEIYIRTKRADLATERLEKYLSTNPDSSHATNLLGQALAMQGDSLKADELFRQAIHLDPANPSPRLNLAETCIRNGEELMARDLLSQLLREDPNNRDAHYLLAWLEVRLGDNARALEIYRMLAQTNPADARALFLAGLHHLESGQISEGEQFADTLLANFPKLASGFLLKGMSLYLRDDFSGGITHLQQSLQAGSNQAGYYFLGLSYFRLGKLELALNQFQKILDLEPEALQPRLMLAMILIKQQRFDEAVVEIEKVLQRDGTNAMAYNLLGSYWMAQGKFDAAMKAFETATELNPGLVDVHIKKGIFHASRGNSVGAESELTTALNAAPQILDTRLLLGAHYLRQKDYAAALRTLQEGLSGKESDALLYNFMAAVCFAQNETEKALNYLLKAKKANPDFLTAYFNLAAYHTSTGGFDRALEEYAAVLQQHPGQLQALILSGKIMEETGRSEQAMEFYRQAAATGKREGVLVFAEYLLRSGKEVEALEILATTRQPSHEDISLLDCQGQVLLRLGRYQEAAAIYAKIERVAPGKGAAGLVRTYLLGGNVAQAEALAREFTVKYPDAPLGYILLGSVFEHRKDIPGALRVLQQGAERSRRDPQLMMRMAILHERTADFAKARRLYEEMLRLAPKDHLIVFALAALHDRQGEKLEAEQRYREVLGLNENFVPALNNLAYLYIESLDNRTESLKLARKAYRLAPANPIVQDTLGYALLQHDRADEALQILRKAAEKLQGNATILYHLAQACQRVGKMQEAVAFLKMALALGEFPERLQTRILLEKLSG